MSSRLYHFSGETLGAIDWCEPHSGETLVADSWFVDDGHAVAMDRHHARFAEAALREGGLDQALVTAFLAAVTDAIPRQGAWFPRIEVANTRGGATLRYRERPAPEREATVSLAVGAHDPRTSPRQKGPDLDALMALRRSVSPLGATEAIIASPSGHIIEGAYSTVVWWRPDAQHLSVVPATTPRIQSVTESVVHDIAHQRGIPVSEETVTVSELEGAEVWILSALHGIRHTSRIAHGPKVNPDPTRRDRWQEAWWGTRTPLSPSH